MALIIFLLILAIPVLELSVLIDVGGEIGALSTVMLCLVTAAVGLSLVRMQGMRIFHDMQTKTRAGEAVGENLIHGFFLLIAGVFLFIPGFITDFFGALLLLPFVRLMLGKAGLAHMVVRSNLGGHGFHHDQHGSKDTTRSETRQTAIIIDGEFSEGETSAAEQEANEVETGKLTEKTPKKHSKDD